PLGEKRNHPGSKLRQGFWMVFRFGVNNWGRNSFTFPNRLGFILFQSIIVLGNFFKPHQLGQFYLRPQNLCFGQAWFSFLVC
ncbi:hypothetical protein, partial [Streptococcus pneumoniae]|uniref:hypothetical protein n=1 Tax=Streptococcus pneumoniae TaxID=1313 RepID=UPI0021BC1EEB